ncbi:MAG: AAA family ATPase [Rhodospirillales bacterium]|nr:AAA family ATPase [Rhodospirillales bacterium]
MSSLFEADYEEEGDPFAPGHEDSLLSDEVLLSPKESDFIVSHQGIERGILSLILKEKMPHALIFCGKKGIGKATFAYRLSRYILKYAGQSSKDSGGLFGGDVLPVSLPDTMDMDKNDPVFRRVISGAHADFLSLELLEGKKGLEVDQIRRVQPFLQKTASEPGAWRVVLIDEADSMNRNAQNALLKILEEPPKNTVLILIAHNLAAFVPTIRSRCRIVAFEAPGRADYLEIMRRYDASTDPVHLDFLYEFTQASPGQSIDFIEHDGLELMTSLREFITVYPNFDWEALHLFCEQFSRGVKEPVWDNFKNTLLWMLQNVLLIRAREQVLPKSLSFLTALQSHARIEDLEKTCRMLHDLFLQAETGNLDKKETALEAFILMEQHLTHELR